MLGVEISFSTLFNISVKQELGRGRRWKFKNVYLVLLEVQYSEYVQFEKFFISPAQNLLKHFCQFLRPKNRLDLIFV